MNDTIKYISDVIEKISGVRNIDKNINLLGPKSKIESYLFIYIFSEFEEKYGEKVYDIFKNNDYTVFTIENIAFELDKIETIWWYLHFICRYISLIILLNYWGNTRERRSLLCWKRNLILPKTQWSHSGM